MCQYLDMLNVSAWLANREAGNGQDLPVFLLIDDPQLLAAVQCCRANHHPFVVIDHPHASEQRNKMARLSVNGITPEYFPQAMVWPNRKYEWNLQPWRERKNLRILHCPSANDQYGEWLGRSESSTSGELEAELHQLQQTRQLAPEWHLALRSRLMAQLQHDKPGLSPNIIAQVLSSAAVADGNSVLLLDALRVGVAAIVWQHPGLPLAHTLAQYAPLRLHDLETPAKWQIEREPLFEQLAMSQLTLAEMAIPDQFFSLIEWQLTNLATKTAK